MNQPIAPINSSLWRVMLPPLLGSEQPPDAPTMDAYRLAASDPAVRKLTCACVAELTRLVARGGADHFLHAAIQGAAIEGTTPVQWLQVQLGMLLSEIELVKKEAVTAASRRRADHASIAPLANAVYQLNTSAVAEGESIQRKLYALRQGSNQVKAAERIDGLRAAGVSDADIEKLGYTPPVGVEHEVSALRQRALELDSILARCRAYSEDPLHDPEHVRGLVSDDLVDAQLARVTTASEYSDGAH